ncbi:MAG: hypothetical protein RID91_12210 [Azospirillaceae bacterium]
MRPPRPASKPQPLRSRRRAAVLAAALALGLLGSVHADAHCGSARGPADLAACPGGRPAVEALDPEARPDPPSRLWSYARAVVLIARGDLAEAFTAGARATN